MNTDGGQRRRGRGRDGRGIEGRGRAGAGELQNEQIKQEDQQGWKERKYLLPMSKSNTNTAAARWTRSSDPARRRQEQHELRRTSSTSFDGGVAPASTDKHHQLRRRSSTSFDGAAGEIDGAAPAWRSDGAAGQMRDRLQLVQVFRERKELGHQGEEGASRLSFGDVGVWQRSSLQHELRRSSRRDQRSSTSLKIRRSSRPDARSTSACSSVQGEEIA